MVPARHDRTVGAEKAGRGGPDRVDPALRAAAAGWLGYRPPHPAHPHQARRDDGSIGSLLVELRAAAGKSQLRLAEQLCAASGVPTVTRHEISRWEREERIPSRFWLGWLAMVLEVPLDLLERVAATARQRRRGVVVARVGPPVPAGRVDALRRADDLVGGADLAGLIERQFRAAVGELSGARTEPARARALAQLAHLGQLLGWVAADAGTRDRAEGALRVALRLATAGGDEALAGLALATLGHLGLIAGNPVEALRVVRGGFDRADRVTSGTGKALLAHRLAYAAARAGQRTECERALGLADRAYERRAAADPGWAYWLDDAEMTAQAGRCYAVLGRHRLAEPLLSRALGGGAIRGRSWAIYATCLAGALLDAGQVDRACQVAGDALVTGIRVGSVRAVGQVAALHRRLVGPGTAATAVREYRDLVASARPYLPGPLIPAPAVHRDGPAASVEP